MTKVPFWKLKREVQRLNRQIIELPGLVWEYFDLRTSYDRDAEELRKTHDGELMLGREVAIYLIFPSDGILASHLDVLAMIVKEGISPVVVSNLPLSDEQISTLSPLTAKIIERPNIGYDFGGYRDGILALEGILPELDRLYILNDSAWMVDAPSSWFVDARAKDVDFCGATSNYGIKRHDAANFRDLRWQYTAQHRNFHYASYALAIGKAILSDPSFTSFWKSFRLSNHKRRTVRRGEIGLTQWVMRKGYSHAATCSVMNLDTEISALDNAELDDLTRHLIIPDHPRVLKKCHEVLKSDPNSPEGRQDRIQIILTAVSAQAMGYVMPYYTLRHRGFQFVKKSPLWISPEGSKTTLHILSKLQGPMGKHAYAEAQNIVAKKAAS